MVGGDPAMHRESLEVLQRALDLEFEMKFETLMRSIEDRLRLW